MTKPKGFAKPKPVIQERRIWLEQKRYFPTDGSELDRGWVKLNLRVINAPGTLHSADWDNLMMRVAAEWVDAFRYPANAKTSTKVPNHLFVYDALRNDVLAQLGLHEFDTRDDRVDQIQVNSRANCPLPLSMPNLHPDS